MQRTTNHDRQTAAEAYAARQAECRDLLDRIGEQLERHQAPQTEAATDWGSAGDLAYVAEQLAYVLAHLGNPSAVDQKKLTY